MSPAPAGDPHQAARGYTWGLSNQDTNMPAPFWIQGIDLGSSANCISEIRVWKGNDPRYVRFGGDAYWQWQFSDGPYRNHGKGFCFTQALHDGLAGWHASILHCSDDRFAVIPEHPDYAHVARMWELAQQGGVPRNFEYSPQH